MKNPKPEDKAQRQLEKKNRELRKKRAERDAFDLTEVQAARDRMTTLLCAIPVPDQADIVDTTESDNLPESLRAPEIDVFVKRTDVEKEAIRAEQWAKTRQKMTGSEKPYHFDVTVWKTDRMLQDFDDKELGGNAPPNAPKASRSTKPLTQKPGPFIDQKAKETWLSDVREGDMIPYPSPHTEEDMKTHYGKRLGDNAVWPHCKRAKVSAPPPGQGRPARAVRPTAKRREQLENAPPVPRSENAPPAPRRDNAPPAANFSAEALDRVEDTLRQNRDEMGLRSLIRAAEQVNMEDPEGGFFREADQWDEDGRVGERLTGETGVKRVGSAGGEAGSSETLSE